MSKKVWTEDKTYCTRCQRFIKPIWDEKRELWVCPLCFRFAGRTRPLSKGVTHDCH